MNGEHVDLPALTQLMGAYLHQDYELFGGTPLDAARTFLINEPALRRAIEGEIDAVLAGNSEGELGKLLVSLGCQLPPWAADGTYASSLREVAAVAARIG